ncbi:hypothetical protein HZH66_009539 [Vespula vulgaris]|uniref:Uncharacterized protein n=1 Tax=Vespula vulgaris TaxID=7454 RepID=A0A834JMR3_VESVU|nr:hypothetical protein HZH66_009539 [Vespula vulgaris]
MTLLKNPIIAALLLQKLILPDLDDDSNTLKLYHEGIKKNSYSTMDNLPTPGIIQESWGAGVIEGIVAPARE